MKNFIYNILLFSFPAAADDFSNGDIGLGGAIILIFCGMVFIVFLLLLPMDIAKNRGVSKEKRRYITVLSFLGLIFVVTWIVALILACVFPSEKEENEKHTNGNDYLFKLNKLGELKQKGVLTDEEFEEEKHKLLDG